VAASKPKRHDKDLGERGNNEKEARETSQRKGRFDAKTRIRLNTGKDSSTQGRGDGLVDVTTTSTSAKKPWQISLKKLRK